MADQAHVLVLKKGTSAWNRWREKHPTVKPDVSSVDISSRTKRGKYIFNMYREDNEGYYRAALAGINFSETNLENASLSYADLTGANFKRAKLNYAQMARGFLENATFTDIIAIQTFFSEAELNGADFTDAKLLKVHFGSAKLNQASFQNAELTGINFNHANLRGANFSGAFLNHVDLAFADLREANFTGAIIARTTFNDVDLSCVIGLDKLTHISPSSVGIDTLYKSAGRIPEEFLRGCGVPDDFVAFIPSHFGLQQAIQFYSCFISYNHKDEEFVRRLYSRMRDEHLRVWFAPEEMKGGERLFDQIQQAIQVHDRLLLVLSDTSMGSEWVLTEIRNALRIEIEENRRKLFPIRLVDFDRIQRWKCFDADAGKDLAINVREYFIPDFSNWKDHDAFEAAFKRLLRDLRPSGINLNRT